MIRVVFEGPSLAHVQQQAAAFLNELGAAPPAAERAGQAPAKTRDEAAERPPAAERGAEPKSDKKYSVDDVIAAMRAHAKAVSPESAVAVVRSFGFQRASEVKAEKRAEVIAALERNEDATASEAFS